MLKFLVEEKIVNAKKIEFLSITSSLILSISFYSVQNKVIQKFSIDNGHLDDKFNHLNIYLNKNDVLDFKLDLATFLFLDFISYFDLDRDIVSLKIDKIKSDQWNGNLQQLINEKSLDFICNRFDKMEGCTLAFNKVILGSNYSSYWISQYFEIVKEMHIRENKLIRKKMMIDNNQNGDADQDSFRGEKINLLKLQVELLKYLIKRIEDSGDYASVMGLSLSMKFHFRSLEKKRLFDLLEQNYKEVLNQINSFDQLQGPLLIELNLIRSSLKDLMVGFGLSEIREKKEKLKEVVELKYKENEFGIIEYLLR